MKTQTAANTTSNAFLAGVMLAHDLAVHITSTLVTQEDWQNWYRDHLGPLPYAESVYGKESQGQVSAFLRTFLEALSASGHPIYVKF